MRFILLITLIYFFGCSENKSHRNNYSKRKTLVNEVKESKNKRKVHTYYYYKLREDSNWKLRSRRKLDDSMVERLQQSSVNRGQNDMIGPLHYFGTFKFGQDITIEIKDYLGKQELFFREPFADDPFPKKRQSIVDEKTLLIEGKWIRAGNLADEDVPKGGNVFGKSGIYKTKNDIEKIVTPKFNATKVSTEFLNSFGAHLYKHGDIIEWNYTNEITCYSDVHFVTYQFGANYIENYVKKYGRFFIEKHKFPHYFTAKNKKDKVYLTLGRNLSKKSIELATFHVPYGYILLLEPNAIHSDSLSIGTVILTLDDCASSDTVFLRNHKDKSLEISIL